MDITEDLSFITSAYEELNSVCDYVIKLIDDQLCYDENGDNSDNKPLIQVYSLWKETNNELDQLPNIFKSIGEKMICKSEKYKEHMDSFNYVAKILEETKALKESKEKNIKEIKKTIFDMNNTLETELKSMKELGINNELMFPIILHRIRNLLIQKQKKESLLYCLL